MKKSIAMRNLLKIHQLPASLYTSVTRDILPNSYRPPSIIGIPSTRLRHSQATYSANRVTSSTTARVLAKAIKGLAMKIWMSCSVTSCRVYEKKMIVLQAATVATCSVSRATEVRSDKNTQFNSRLNLTIQTVLHLMAVTTPLPLNY